MQHRSITHLRVLKRLLPRNAGQETLLACPTCCSLRRRLYGWEPGGQFTTSAQKSQWQCRVCAGLRYASEGGAPVSRSCSASGKLFEGFNGPLRAPRPEPWLPLVFYSPKQAGE
jgi:hypothetical protein